MFVLILLDVKGKTILVFNDKWPLVRKLRVPFPTLMHIQKTQKYKVPRYKENKVALNSHLACFNPAQK